MEKFIKIPKFMVLFCLYLILTWNFEFMISSILMHYEKENALILVIILIIFSVILIIFLKFPKLNLIKKIANNYLIKIPTCLYLLLSIIYSLFCFTIILRNWFYPKTPLIILLVFFTLIILLIHKNLNFIFYLGFFIGILFFIPNLLTIFCANNRNIAFLNLISFNFKKGEIIFVTLFPFLDLLMYLPFKKHLHKDFTKKDFIIVTILAGFSALLMMADNYLFLLPDTFEIFNQPALLKYRIYQLDPLGESLDFVILIDIVYLLIIKNSLYLYLLRVYQKAKFKSLTTLLLIISIFVCPYVLMKIDDYKPIHLVFGIILSVLIIVFYLILQIIARKENRNVKQ